jgi:outer membrane protein assembly factor BamB
MNYLKIIGSQIFRIIISIPFLFIIPTNFLANAAEDGTLKWTFKNPYCISVPVNCPAIGLDGTIYVGSSSRLCAINPDGTLKWKIGLTHYFTVNSPAIGLDGTIYVGSDDYHLNAINPDGTLKWEFRTHVKVSSPAIGLDGTIYYGLGGLYAINPDGTQKWVFTEGSGHPAIGLEG